MNDPCERCLISANCSNACVELMTYYGYLSKKVRATLEDDPGVTKEQIKEFEKLEKRGKAIVKWWKMTEGIRD